VRFFESVDPVFVQEDLRPCAVTKPFIRTILEILNYESKTDPSR
jgi:hypothetical protein